MIQLFSLIVLAAVPASSHVGISPPGGASGGRFTGYFRIPHGCDGASTDRVTIEIPAMKDAEGVMQPLISVKPEMPSKAWTVTTEYRILDPPVEYHGLVNKTVSKIIWTINPGYKSIPNHMYKLFGVSFKIPAVPEGRYPFNVQQHCDGSDGTGEGMLDWSDLSEGAKRPPPRFAVTKTAEDDGHGSHGSSETMNDSSSHMGGHGEAMEALNQGKSMMLETEKNKMDTNKAMGIAGLVIGSAGFLIGCVSMFMK